MKITVIKTRDILTPSLKRQIRLMSDPRPALKAVGTLFVSLALRAFNDASLRPKPWAPLSPATLAARKRAGRGAAILRRTGTLARSPRIITLTRTSVTIGSDRAYASYHQFGSRDGKRPPARPFFPFTTTGSVSTPTLRARTLAVAAVRRTLQLRK